MQDDKFEKKDAERIRGQQHTGNHKYPGKEQGGPDKLGGTRAGAENVEPAQPKNKGGSA